MADDRTFYATIDNGRSSGRLHARRDCRYIANTPDDRLVSGGRERFAEDQELCSDCGTRWADTLPADAPACPPPELLEDATVERRYCEAHEVVLIPDALGRNVCVACIVEEASDV